MTCKIRRLILTARNWRHNLDPLFALPDFRFVLDTVRGPWASIQRPAEKFDAYRPVRIKKMDLPSLQPSQVRHCRRWRRAGAMLYRAIHAVAAASQHPAKRFGFSLCRAAVVPCLVSSFAIRASSVRRGVSLGGTPPAKHDHWIIRVQSRLGSRFLNALALVHP